MGKMTTYMLVMSGILVLMYYSGMIPTGNTLLVFLLNPNTMQNASISNTIIVALQLTGIAAISIAGFRVNRPELIAAGTVAVLLFDLGFNFITVYGKIVSINPSFTPVATLIFSPLLFLYVVTIFEWWRGITT